MIVSPRFVEALPRWLVFGSIAALALVLAPVTIPALVLVAILVLARRRRATPPLDSLGLRSFDVHPTGRGWCAYATRVGGAPVCGIGSTMQSAIDDMCRKAGG